MKIQYECKKCQTTFPKWSGQCSSCGEWNTLEEKQVSEIQQKIEKKREKIVSAQSLVIPEKQENKNFRISSGIKELDRVIGGGFFYDSLTLLTGDPGIGKSTLSLQISLEMAKKISNKKVIIVSGEESVSQISDRMFRLQKNLPENIFLLSENILESAIETIKKEDIGFLTFDSVQTLLSLDGTSGIAGSLSQINLVTEKIMHFCKTQKIPTLLIGHVTKEGSMAGPQTLAHMVDTTLHLEGERFSEMRILRSQKNRFGSTGEIGIFEMNEKGLTEVKNPSENFLSGRLQNPIGSAIFCVLEGNRPLLVEVQALTKYTSFGYPKRSSSGFDNNRLGILIAVAGKYSPIKLDQEDVFVNIVGGVKVVEPAVDLALIAAIFSSKKKIPLPEKTIFLGEVGLSGEIRHVAKLDKRLKEAEKMGFEKVVLPKNSRTGKTNMEVISLQTVGELFNRFFG